MNYFLDYVLLDFNNVNSAGQKTVCKPPISDQAIPDFCWLSDFAFVSTATVILGKDRKLVFHFSLSHFLTI